MQTKELGEFEDIMKVLTNEYVEKHGIVTCEFSTDGSDLAGKLKFCQKYNKEIFTVRDGYYSYWVIYFCDTCEGYNVEFPFHVMIMEVRA